MTSITGRLWRIVLLQPRVVPEGIPVVTGLRDFGKDAGGIFVGLWEGFSETVTGIYQSGWSWYIPIAELALGTKGATKLGSLAKSNLRGMGNILRSERGSISFGEGSKYVPNKYGYFEEVVAPMSEKSLVEIKQL